MWPFRNSYGPTTRSLTGNVLFEQKLKLYAKSISQCVYMAKKRDVFNAFASGHHISASSSVVVAFPSKRSPSVEAIQLAGNSIHGQIERGVVISSNRCHKRKLSWLTRVLQIDEAAPNREHLCNHARRHPKLCIENKLWQRNTAPVPDGVGARTDIYGQPLVSETANHSQLAEMKGSDPNNTNDIDCLSTYQCV